MSLFHIKLPTGEIHGPYTRSQLEDQLAQGTLPTGTMTSIDGMWRDLSVLLGTAPPPGKNVAPCQDCGGNVSRRAASCPHCGAPMHAVSETARQTPTVIQPQPVVLIQAQQVRPPNQSERSRVAFVLLGLFLGGLGIHNFYAGYSGRGVMQLLITVLLGWWLIFPLFIVGLWALIEIASVTQDADGKTFN